MANKKTYWMIEFVPVKKNGEKDYSNAWFREERYPTLAAAKADAIHDLDSDEMAMIYEFIDDQDDGYGADNWKVLSCVEVLNERGL